jgi:phosphoribosylaminoimidazolecarboxamide formyltransferase/IMP cyclohydrolase
MRALLSLSDKTDLISFARGLHGRGIELISTGGTARALTEGGLPVMPVSDVTRFPEMLDGRVKTLHPAIHGGILARRNRPDDLEALSRHAITPIDLVVVNLYPFARAAADPSTTVPALIEEIDIGGPSLIRAAAKNFTDVMVVVDPADYVSALEALDRQGGVPREFRLALARKAFAHTAAYDDMIASAFDGLSVADNEYVRISAMPRLAHEWRPRYRKLRDLRYGENPHQAAAWYADETQAGFGDATILQGKELSFTNLLDLDAAARIALEFDDPAAVVIKHTNPCGVAKGATAADAYVRAREADPLSAFGGIVGLNRPIDVETARAVTSTFIEAVVAPRVEDDARAVLGQKTNMRVVTADFSLFRTEGGHDVRSLLGGLLVQDRDRVDEPDEALKIVTKRPPTSDEWRALRFAWKICAHVKSNAVIFTAADRTLAVGAGQMSRVDAVKVAVMKGGDALKGSVAASDAFFPFRDGLDALAAAGATAVIQPGGSVRDPEVISAADEHGLAMVFTGRRHFRH